MDLSTLPGTCVVTDVDSEELVYELLSTTDRTESYTARLVKAIAQRYIDFGVSVHVYIKNGVWYGFDRQGQLASEWRDVPRISAYALPQPSLDFTQRINLWD